TLFVDEAALSLGAYGGSLDTILFCRGVRHSMYQFDLSKSYLVNTRPAQQSNYGWGGGVALGTPNGGVLKGSVAPMLAGGEVLGLKLKGNWKITTKPTPSGGGSAGQIEPKDAPARQIPTVFKGPLWGFNSPRVPILNANGEYVDGVQYPAYAVYNMVPENQ